MDENPHSFNAHYKDIPTDTLLACLKQLMQEVEQIQKTINRLTDVLNHRGIDVSSIDFENLPNDKKPILCSPLKSLFKDYARFPSYVK